MKYGLPDELNDKARALVERCRERGLRVSTVESCTGGLLSYCLTDIPGASDIYDRGFITYSNEAKQEEVGVRAASLEKFGAVSAEVAREMCAGALTRKAVGVAASITGIAGPGGATADKPVGLVYIGIATAEGVPAAYRYIFPGDRQEVRTAAVAEALDLLLNAVAVKR